MDNTTLDAVKQEVAQISSLVEDRLEAGMKPLQEEVDRMSKALTEVQSQHKEARRHELAQVSEGAARGASASLDAGTPHGRGFRR